MILLTPLPVWPALTSLPECDALTRHMWPWWLPYLCEPTDHHCLLQLSLPA